MNDPNLLPATSQVEPMSDLAARFPKNLAEFLCTTFAAIGLMSDRQKGEAVRNVCVVLELYVAEIEKSMDEVVRAPAVASSDVVNEAIKRFLPPLKNALTKNTSKPANSEKSERKDPTPSQQ